ncbi:MAG: Spy/CpxP family protein refolding chaperone [Candidatus Aminicenantes bacterium]|nr:MAG: Spy/CpxP family protein refolding chaperone [Candidatus Aminicenantes bacterium]
MKKIITLSVIFSFLILFAASSFAQPQHRMMRRGKNFANRAPARILSVLKAKKKELKITDSQIEKIKSLTFSFEEKMIKMRSNCSLQRLEIKKLFQDRENLDYDKIKAALSKASSGRHDMVIERLKLREEIGKILTPEQREAIKSMQKDRLKQRAALLRKGRGLFQRGEREQQFPRLKRRIRR